MDPQAFEQAVRSYWTVRESQAAKQLASGKVDAGLRGAVTGGAQLDALGQLLAEVFQAAGVPASAIHRRAGIHLPGYYRPSKRWDLVVVDQGHLVAAVEFKSQVGPSFGNNFNNRAEEAIGNAVDVWRAYEAGAFGSVRPWLGYVFLLEKSERSTKEVSLAEGVFPVDPVFRHTSYQDRYRIMCRRLVEDGLYDAACFVTSSQNPDEPIHQPDPELSFANLTAAIAGRVAHLKALDGGPRIPEARGRS